MFNFLKLKVYIKGDSLIIKKGLGRVKPAREMSSEEFTKKIKECIRAGITPYAVAASVWNLPDGVTELKTNLRFLRYIDNADRAALCLWYVAKYDRDTYFDIVERLKEIGCSRDG